MHKYSRAVHEQHEKYGPFVRLSPDHVSVGHPDYIKVRPDHASSTYAVQFTLTQDVMGHGNSFSKSRFYEIFDWNSQSIFTTRSREIHARKRKWMSATFSARSIKDFERFMTDALLMYGRQMENLIDGKVAGRYAYPRNDEVTKRMAPDEGVLDATIWNAFLAFDIIGDLVSNASPAVLVP